MINENTECYILENITRKPLVKLTGNNVINEQDTIYKTGSVLLIERQAEVVWCIILNVLG